MVLLKFFIGQDQPQINCPSEFNEAGKINWIDCVRDFRKKSRTSNPENPVNPV